MKTLKQAVLAELREERWKNKEDIIGWALVVVFILALTAQILRVL